MQFVVKAVCSSHSRLWVAVTDWDSEFAKLPSTASSDPTERPVVQLLPGELPDAVDKAENALIAAGPGPIFQRGGQLVHVTDRPARRIDGTDDRQIAIAPVGSDAILEAFDLSARFEKFDARARNWKKVDVPRRLAETYAGRARWGVPDLAQIISAPTLRPDGSLLNRKGYDRPTRLHLSEDWSHLEIAERPSKAQAEDANDELTNLLLWMPLSFARNF